MWGETSKGGASAGSRECTISLYLVQLASNLPKSMKSFSQLNSKDHKNVPERSKVFPCFENKRLMIWFDLVAPLFLNKTKKASLATRLAGWMLERENSLKIWFLLFLTPINNLPQSLKTKTGISQVEFSSKTEIILKAPSPCIFVRGNHFEWAPPLIFNSLIFNSLIF